MSEKGEWMERLFKALDFERKNRRYERTDRPNPCIEYKMQRGNCSDIDRLKRELKLRRMERHDND